MIMFLSPSAPPPSTLAPQHLVSSLHTFLQYLCAHVKLGTSQSSQETTALGGNWGGTESIGVCVIHLQNVHLQTTMLELS